MKINELNTNNMLKTSFKLLKEMLNDRKINTAYLDKLTEEEKDQVENAVKSLEEAIKSENVESIETSTKELNDVLTPLTQKLYTPEDGATASDSEGDASSDNAGDNTVDAEFEEVKEEDK